MTVRAVVIGFVAAAFMCAYGFFNDLVIDQTFLIGNYLPIYVYGGLLVFLLVVNPLLIRAWKGSELTGRELAFIVAMVLPACYVPGRGLMHYFTTALMMPRHFERTDAGWQEQDVVNELPQVMLAGVTPHIRDGDVRDPCGMCLELVRAGDGGTAAPEKAADEESRKALLRVRRVWGFFGEADRGRVRAAAERALAPPGEPLRGRVLEHIGNVLDEEHEPTARETEIARGALASAGSALDAAFGGEGLGAARRASGAAVSVALEHALPPRARERIGAPFRDAFSAPFKGGAHAAIRARARAAGLEAATLVLSTAHPVAERRTEALGRLRSVLEAWGLPQGKREEVAVSVADALAAHDPACREALLGPLNAILTGRDLRDAEYREGLTLPKEAEELLKGEAATADERRPVGDEPRMTLGRHLVDAAFPDGLRNLEGSRDYAITGFAQGLGEGSNWIGFQDVPWYAWWRTLLAFWVPLILAMSFAMIGLALVVHRQWSTHEHLPYPIIQFASSLLPAEGEARGGVFRNRLFWVGTGAVFLLHCNNYLYQWWPDLLVQVPRYFDFNSLAELFPNLQRGGTWALLNPTIYFTAVGFAYFISTELSLSIGIAPFIYATVAGVFAGYGVSFGGGWFSTGIEFSLYAGAYFGMFLFLAYTGRRWFAQVFRRSVGLSSGDDIEAATVWGARVFLAGTLVFMVMLVMVGLAWYWAAVYTAGVIMVFVVVARVVAETGCFFIHPYSLPGAALAGFLGAKVLGPKAMLIMFFVTSLLLIDPREAVMPFMVHGLKFIEGRKISPGRTAAWGAAAIVLGLAVALPVVLYLQYSMGGVATGDGWTLNCVPKFAMNVVAKTKERLVAQGALSQAGNMGFLESIGSIAPAWPAVTGFLVTMGLVLGFSFARLRFARWPLHPVMFLILGTFQSRTLAVSFLLGWFIKVIVTKYGGATVYQRLKPLMIGIIAGDLFGGILPMIVGTIYYFWTGDLPKSYRVLPT